MKKEIIVNMLRDEVVVREGDSEQVESLYNSDLQYLTDHEVVQHVKNKLERASLVSEGIESYHVTIIRD